jgi:long-chain fatty acid transport protein
VWQVTPATRVGLAYRSEIDATLEGDLKVNGVLATAPVFASVTLPDSAALSVFHRLNERWELLADVSWTGWSDFDVLRIANTAGVAVVPVVTENWADSYRYSLGANYRVNERLMLRGGVAFDETPVSNAYRTARIPDEDRTWLAFGAQYRLSTKTVLDIGYAHLFVKDASVADPVTGPIVRGSYDGSVDILSAQLTLDF